jgi:tRNA-Thr(GGU) m(6)t(6)A37 methyltransferase TsaA
VQALQPLTLTPIGIVHSPFTDRQSAPRQAALAADVQGTIELLPDARYEHALRDLDGFSHIWVLFWFDRNEGFRPTVQPPRSSEKRGVFATRAPYRPNPLGMSVVRLERVEGRILHVRGLDILDQTPVLDIKPYVTYADSVPDARQGWLANELPQVSQVRPRDAGPRYEVTFSERAEEQLAWLAARTELPLRRMAEEILADGPAPHPYRRIRDLGDGFRLGLKDFRLRFTVDGTQVRVLEIATGYRKSTLDDPDAVATERTPLDVHRAFIARFGPRPAR